MSSTAKNLLQPVAAGLFIDHMSEHDLLEVVEIEEGSGLSRWGWSAYYAELQSANRILMFVARIASPLEQDPSYNLAGYIVARLGAQEIHINNVAVREEYRRKGIGGALLNRVLAQGQQLGAQTALLEVRCGNTAAQALYQTCGFYLIGRRPKYYSDPLEDALVLGAKLA